MIYALFDTPVSTGSAHAASEPPVDGVPAIYSFTGMLRTRGYSWFASALQPASLAAHIASLPPAEHLALMAKFHYMTSVTVTMKDEPERSRVEREADLLKLEREPMSYDRLLLYSDHTSGGNSFGVDRARGVTDPTGRVFGSSNVYVA
jgi:choline dehydrogenase-like flavoprotein